MKRSKKGFTLVELLVVIAIIAIIAAVAVPVTISQINKAKIGTAVDEANQVKTNAANVITEMATSPDGKVTEVGLAKGLNDFYTEMKQVKHIYVYQAQKGADIIVTIVTGTAAPELSDATKGYIAVKPIDVATTTVALVGKPLDGQVPTDKTDADVAVQFKMKGTGVTVGTAAVAAPGCLHIFWGQKGAAAPTGNVEWRVEADSKDVSSDT